MPLGKITVFLEMIKFEHTIFALPFVYMAVFLAEGQLIINHNLIWITLAMVGARTTAMSLNRIIDRYIDAENPRTRSRALPKGLISLVEAWLYTIGFTALFIVSAYQLSPLAFKISPVCVLAFVFYSYTKRFTWLSHYVLGLTIGFAPLSAWIAISNAIDTGIVLLSLGVALWVAGFDIIYACDDFDFDRTTGLFSIPARFGVARALTVSAITHVGAMVFFILTGIILMLGVSYWIGLILAGILMFKQHAAISPINLSKINFAFFNLNGTLSIVMFLATILDMGIR
ncbi:UbiA-like polyprenyltransferase [Sporomusa aerivorans]|uniref:UbiA-like polyprenyltransferase n=1 Tax=Sporomusa aerivorans TaxID=204936 RepID=UPI00352A79F2